MMTNQYRYSLDKSRPSKKWPCPQCNKKKLVRYIDTNTNDYLPEEVGRCDREGKCQYHLTPNQYFALNGGDQKPPNKPKKRFIPPKRIPTSYISHKLVQASLRAYKKNHFVLYLHSLFSEEVVNNLIQKFKIGTSKHWIGANVFWQIDEKGKARTGKVMLYNSKTGKRVKKPFNHIDWVHSLLKKKNKQDFHLTQCLFGIHQIIEEDNTKLIGIVESEKTAILMSAIQNNYLWMATGGLSNINYMKLKPIMGRKIIFFPDLGAFDKWKVKANDLIKQGFQIKLSNVLEENATEEARNDGYDLADYFITK